MNFLRLDLQGVLDLTTEELPPRSTSRCPTSPGVRYYSVSAARPWTKIPPFALHSWRVVYAADGDNDRLVSVRSAKWGEHLATWPADHWLTLNHRFTPEFHRTTGDITAYWLTILDRLKADGLLAPDGP